MKKRFLSIIFAMALAATAAACGSSADVSTTETESEDKTVPEKATTEEDSAAEASTQEASSVPGEEAAKTSETGDLSSPQLLSRSDYTYVADESGKFDEPLLTGHIEILSMTKESEAAFPKLASALGGYMSEITEKAYKTQNEYLDLVKEDRANIAADDTDPYVYESYYNRDYYITRLDSKCLSLMACDSAFVGGAHGYAEYSSVNYDTQTGEKLSISDVIPDEDSFNKALVDALLAFYDEEDFFAYDSNESLEDEIKEFTNATYHPESLPADEETTYELVWSLTAEGLQVYFNAYAIAPYASGTISALIPYSSGLFDEAFVPGDDCTIISEVPLYMPIYADTNADKTVEEYLCYGKESSDYPDEYTGIVVHADSGDTTLEEDFFSYRTFLARAEGKRFILFDASSYNDYHFLYSIGIDKGTVDVPGMQNLPCDSFGQLVYKSDTETEPDYDLWYYSYIPTDSSNMVLAKRFDLLSSYSGNNIYKLNADGTATAKSDNFTVYTTYALKSVKDIEAETLGDDGSAGEKKTFPTGTEFTIIATNGNDTVDVVTGDGQKARFTIKLSEDGVYSATIGGVAIEDLFETLYFAG